MFMSPNSYKLFYETLKTINIIKKFIIFGTSTNKDVISFTNLQEKHIYINNYKPYDFKGKYTVN